MIELKDKIYKPVDGDEIIFLKNYFDNNQTSKLKKGSTALYYENYEIYFENAKRILNDFNFDELLFRKIFLSQEFRTYKRYHIFVIHNNEVKIARFGLKIKEKLLDEILKMYDNTSRIFDLYYPKPFSIRIENVNGFQNFDYCNFSNNAVTILSKSEILDKMKELADVYEKLIINNSLRHNLNCLLSVLKNNDPIQNHPLIKQYLRFDKLNEILKE